MKKFVLFSTLLALYCADASARKNSPERAVVYLVNGVVIRGQIVEDIPGETLKVVEDLGDTIAYQYELIQSVYLPKSREARVINPAADMKTRMTAAQIAAQKRATDNVTGYLPKSKGYMGIIEANVGYGLTEKSAGSEMGAGRLQATLINGYKFNPYFYLGLGTGVNYYLSHENNLSVPLYGHMRVDFMDQNTTPYLALNLGANVAVKDQSTNFNGLLAEVALGVSFRVSDLNCVYLGLCYAKNKMELSGGTSYWEKSTGMNFVLIKVGFTF